MQEKKISIASDHAGCVMKAMIVEYLRSKNHIVIDLGAFDSDVPVDYADQADKVAKSLYRHESDFGVLLCGTGVGMSIAINRYPFVRGALVSDVHVAELSRQHNNANVLVLGARVLDEETAIACLEVFLNTPFEGGRHEVRVKKLGELPHAL